MDFGNNSPPKQSIDDICPATTCPECLNPKYQIKSLILTFSLIHVFFVVFQGL